MSARPDEALGLRAFDTRDLDAVMAIETRVYGFPWTRGNFIDSLAAGYLARALAGREPGIVAYLVAMRGVGELHLLNLTVTPAWQGRGLARRLLDALEAEARADGAGAIWLEVRESNARARGLYRRRGFVEVGRRRGYYPAPHGSREDAVVMNLRLDGGVGDGVE